MKIFNRSSLKKTKSVLMSAVLLASQVVPFLGLSATAKAADTGFNLPTTTHTPNGWGAGALGDASNGLTDNGQYAEANPQNQPEQGFSNFGISIPAGSIIDGIQLQAEAKSNDSGTDCDLGVELSWNNGTNFTSSGFNESLGSSDALEVFGGASSTWGRSWSAAEFSNANFVVRLKAIDPSQCSDSSITSVDYLQVKVYYTEPSDLVVTKSNNVSGSVVVGNSFNWVLTVSNNGQGSASFSNNQDILQDNLPTDASYSNPAVLTGGGVTGTIDCGISSDNLDCDADGTVVIPAGGWFTVTITVTPDGVGTLANPRSGGGNMCKVDPDNLKSESNEANNTCSDSVSVTLVQPSPNPVLGQSCGLDIALVIDNSTSIDSGELATMKTAMTAFTTAFAGTPTQFSVTRFATTGAVLQPFTTDFTAVNSAINGIPVGGGYTNWEDGLLKAQGTFDPRTNPNLVVFASDGNPNRVDNGTDVSETQATNEAVLVANNIKTVTGARIIALGIGNDLDTANLQAVSSADAVITSDFAALAQTLADLAATLCGGTITTTKLVDVDGDPSTTGDQTVAENWEFDVNGSPSNPSPVSTDANGQTPAVEVDPGTYSVNETAKNGYKVVGAKCYKNQEAVGSWQNGSTSVTGITVGATDIVSCVFINTLNQGTLIVKKVVVNDNGGKLNAEDFGFKVDGGSTVAFESDGQNDLTVTAGEYTVTEQEVSGYSATYDNCTDVVVPIAGSATCTITNNDRAPSLTLNKNLEDNIYGGGYSSAAWTLIAKGATNLSGKSGVTSDSDFSAGTYELSEEGPGEPAFIMGDWDCGDVDLTDATLVVNLGDNITCTVTNTAVQPKLTVIKVVKNGDSEGGKSASDFTMNVSGTDVSDSSFSGDENGTTVGLDAGSYEVTEGDHEGYAVEYSKGCEGTIELGEELTCTVTNTRLGTIKIVKDAQPDSEQAFTFTGNLTGDDGPNFELTDDGVNPGLAYREFALEEGTYTVTEPSVKDWDLDSINCTEGSDVNVNERNVVIKLGIGENVTCTFINKQRTGNVTVVKYNDQDRDGYFDEDETTLPNWDIVLGETTQTTDVNGETTFTNLLPGWHELSEVQQDGWNYSDTYCEYDGEPAGTWEGDYYAQVYADETTHCYIGNYKDPALQIAKTNNSGESKKVEETVTYSITLANAADGSFLYNPSVSDTPPAGFSYVSGSWTATSDLRGDLKAALVVAEPNFGVSPVVWTFGGADASEDVLMPGETITLTYQMKIAKSVVPGTYTNYATGSACGIREFNYEDTIYRIVNEQLVNRDCVTTEKVHSDVKVKGVTIVLAQTGVSSYIPVAFGLVLIGGALLTTRRKFVLDKE